MHKAIKVFVGIFLVFLVNATILSNFIYLAENREAAYASTTTEYTQEQIRNLAMELYSHLIINKPELTTAINLYNGADYLGFLKEIRNLAINNLRKADLGEYVGQNIYQPAPYSVSLDRARYLVGEFTKDEYDIKRPNQPLPKGLTDWGVAGHPSIPISANMLNIGNNVDNGYLAFREFICLPAIYWSTGEKIYADKWFQIFEQYSDNYFKDAREIFKDTPETVFEMRPLKYGYASALACSWRADATIKQFAIIAKSLPGPNSKQTDYMKVLESINEKPYEASYDLIDPVKACKYILACERDHMDYLYESYIMKRVIGDEVANQTMSGITAMTSILMPFDFFNSFEVKKPYIDDKIRTFFRGSVHKDGAQIEQHFNYNKGTLKEFYNIQKYLKIYSNQNSELNAIDTLIDNAKKLFETIRTPLGLLANVGGGDPIYPQRAWESDQLYNNYVNAGGYGPIQKYNGFTSIAFPYGGYYVLRNGWEKDDTYVFIQNARRAFGHFFVSNNSIEFVSKRRNLIMGGGYPYYNESNPHPDFKSDWRQYNAYSGEDANMSRSTIAVDGRPQTRGTRIWIDWLPANTQVNGGVARTVDGLDPINSKWSDSDTFTYYEGNYDGGFITANNVSHYRQSILIKPLDILLVSDIIGIPSNQTHTISQMWNFPPFLTVANDGIDVPGFKENEVVYNSAEKSIMTQDPTGPNVFLKSFSNYSVNTMKYYGHKATDDYYLGWYANSNDGKRHPKVDMHVNWQATSSTTPLVTAISSSKTLTSTVTNYTNLSTDKISGFEALAQSNKITYLSAKAPQTMRANSNKVEVIAETLVTLEKDGVIKGVVNNCSSFKISGVSKTIQSGSFEFQITENDLVIKKDIIVPTTFKWEEDSNGMYTILNSPNSPTMPFQSAKLFESVGAFVSANWTSVADIFSESGAGGYLGYKPNSKPYTAMWFVADFGGVVDVSAINIQTIYSAMGSCNFYLSETLEGIDSVTPIAGTLTNGGATISAEFPTRSARYLKIKATEPYPNAYYNYGLNFKKIYVSASGSEGSTTGLANSAFTYGVLKTTGEITNIAPNTVYDVHAEITNNDVNTHYNVCIALYKEILEDSAEGTVLSTSLIDIKNIDVASSDGKIGEYTTPNISFTGDYVSGNREYNVFARLFIWDGFISPKAKYTTY